MSNEVLTPPEEQTEQQRRLDHTELLPIGAEGGVWQSLISNVRDVFRPVKLPPLELTSTPIAVKDPLAVERSPLTSAISTGVHVAIIALIILLFLFLKKQPQIKQAVVTPIDIAPFLPKAPKLTAPAGGGGGGGEHTITPPTKGRIPPITKVQITPPQTLTVDHPKIPVTPSVVLPPLKLPDTNVPNIGIPQAPAVTLSGGAGSNGIGSGKHGGLGIGSGNGVGPGSDSGYGGGPLRPGGGISSPKVIFSVEPEFSDEARRQKYQGEVVLSLIVDAQGNPQRIRVIRPLGLGLDEKAVQAVRQYKFRPAMEGGKPVPVEIDIEVNFQLF